MLILAIATVLVPAAAAVLAWATIAATCWREARRHYRLPHNEPTGAATYRQDHENALTRSPT